MISHTSSVRFSSVFDQLRDQAKPGQPQGSGSSQSVNETGADAFVSGANQPDANAPHIAEGENPKGGIVGFFKKVIKFGTMIYGAYLAVKTIWNKIASLFSSKKTQEA
jgi:hypothetical protein